MSPLRESYENKFGRKRYRNIWMCNNWECRKQEPREEITIYCIDSDEGDTIDTADDIRVLNILSGALNLTHKETLEKLKSATMDNPIEYQTCKFWAEKE